MALPSPLKTPSPSPTPHTTTTTTPTLAHLDALLETYLTHLDTYTTLRAQLSAQLSSGFFALARANHTSTSRRYGEEGYDERMKAGRRVAVRRKREDESETSGEQEQVDRIEYAVDTYPAPEETGAGKKMHKENSEDQAQDMTPDGAEADDSRPSKAEAIQKPDDAAPKPTTSTRPKSSTLVHRNPLNWYGILVPTSLRQAQTSFMSAVDGPIPALVNVSAQMAELEAQIEDVRTVLGLDVHEEEEQERGNEQVKNSEAEIEEEEQQKKVAPKKQSSPLRLAPRSRVLKLDS